MERPCRCGSTGGTCGDLVQSSFSLDILTRDQDSLVCVAEGHAEVGRLTRRPNRAASVLAERTRGLVFASKLEPCTFHK